MVNWLLHSGRGVAEKVAPLSGYWRVVESANLDPEGKKTHIYSSRQLKSFKVWLDFTSRNVSTVRSDLDKLHKEIKSLKKEIEEIKDACCAEIELRDLSYGEARSEIVKFFKDNDGQNFDAADIQDLLGIDISLAIQVCDELESKGEIKSV